MNLDALLTELVARKGSDLFITVGTPPTLKVNGHLQSLAEAPSTRPGRWRWSRRP